MCRRAQSDLVVRGRAVGRGDLAGAPVSSRSAGRTAALFYVLTLLYFFKPMTSPWVNIATDALGLMPPPWSATSQVNKFSVSNSQMHDLLMQMTPFADQARKARRSGHLPLWQDPRQIRLPRA
jgi:hypothetical protein